MNGNCSIITRALTNKFKIMLNQGMKYRQNYMNYFSYRDFTPKPGVDLEPGQKLILSRPRIDQGHIKLYEQQYII